MKYVICVPDGCADLPVEELDGKTPLEAAEMPVLDELAARGTVGLARVIPKNLPPGSDVGNMSIFGYDPSLYHTGRAPIEAAALGLRLRQDQVAFRCNLVSVSGADPEVMLDFAGGHPTTPETAPVIEALNQRFAKGGFAAGEVSFHTGVSYRHIMVAPREWLEVECTPPHDLTSQPVVLPAGQYCEPIRELMETSKEVLSDFSLKANQIWLWGQGRQLAMPNFAELWGKTAGLVTAVDLVRGLGVLTGIEIVEVEGATAWYDTNYEGKRDAALEVLRSGHDVAVLHVEATDEAGHAGDVAEKVKALENWDSRIFDGLVDGLNELGDWRMLVMPDHATPLSLRSHTSDPVPWLLVDSRKNGPGGTYTEKGVMNQPVEVGHMMMPKLLEKAPVGAEAVVAEAVTTGAQV